MIMEVLDWWQESNVSSNNINPPRGMWSFYMPVNTLDYVVCAIREKGEVIARISYICIAFLTVVNGCSMTYFLLPSATHKHEFWSNAVDIHKLRPKLRGAVGDHTRCHVVSCLHRGLGHLFWIARWFGGKETSSLAMYTLFFFPSNLLSLLILILTLKWIALRNGRFFFPASIPSFSIF